MTEAGRALSTLIGVISRDGTRRKPAFIPGAALGWWSYPPSGSAQPDYGTVSVRRCPPRRPMSAFASPLCVPRFHGGRKSMREQAVGMLASPGPHVETVRDHVPGNRTSAKPPGRRALLSSAGVCRVPTWRKARPLASISTEVSVPTTS